MNKSRFIELLNLYLDNELSAEEADELLHETRRDPRRYELYLQYCRIHKACSSLDPILGEKTSSWSFRQLMYSVGGMAATLALLFFAAQNLRPMFEVATQPAEFAANQAESDPESSFSVDTEEFEVMEPRIEVPSPSPQFVSSPPQFVNLLELDRSTEAGWDSVLLHSKSETASAFELERLFMSEDPMNPIRSDFDRLLNSIESFEKPIFKLEALSLPGEQRFLLIGSPRGSQPLELNR